VCAFVVLVAAVSREARTAKVQMKVGVMWMKMNLIVRNGSELAATTQMTTHSFRRGLDNGMMNASSARMGGV
jgi:hypothetical protein